MNIIHRFALFALCFGLLFTAFSCNVKAVSLNKESIQLELGGEEQLIATITPDNAKKNNLTWTSSSPTVIGVDANGLVSGLAVGKATITVTAESGVTATCAAEVVSYFFISATDISISDTVYNGYSYRIFESESFFLEKIKRALPAGTEISISDVVLQSLSHETDSFLEGKTDLVVGQAIPSGFFGTYQNSTGTAEATYSKKFSFTVKVKNVVLEFKWKTGADDSFTLPAKGTIAFSSGDFIVSNISTTAFNLSLVNLKSKIQNSFGVGEELGDGFATIVVKNGATVLKTVTNATITNSPIDLSVSGLTAATQYTLSFEITLTLTSGKTPDILSAFTIGVRTHNTAIAVGAISPLHISIARVTDAQGVPTGEASALLNYGGEMEYLLKTSFPAYADYNFTTAKWQANLVDTSTSATVATISDAPYTKRVVFSLGLDKAYSLRVSNLTILAPSKEDSSIIQPLTFTWGSDTLFGNSIAVKNAAEYPSVIYFDANHDKAASGTKYSLVYADDFNYHFNGLNYKNWALYDAVKDSSSSDPEAYAYSNKWNPCGIEPRRETVWDPRTIETKNSVMYQKTLAAEPTSGTIYMGYGRTRPVTGFSGMNTTQGTATVLTGQSKSNTVRFGYVEAKLRIRKRAYHSALVNGPWYAFWLHGDMHEFDIMEALGYQDTTQHNVNHYHNGWGAYGSTFNSKAYLQPTFTDYESQWFTLSLYWDAQRCVYSRNGVMYSELVADASNYTATWYINNNRSASNGSFSPGGTATSYTGNRDPQIGGTGIPLPYDLTRLKAIMDVPENIHLSTECGSLGWGGSWTGVEDKLPTWIEFDYVAYYLPDAAVTAIDITGNPGNSLLVDQTLNLSVSYTPSYTSQKGVTWSVSPSGIVTVVDGLVTAIAPGTATITATSTANGTIQDTTQVTVVSTEVPVSSVTVLPTTADFTIGVTEPIQLTATVLPTNATIKTVTWESSNESVATVSSDGLVTAVAVGTATITVTSTADGSKTAECAVTVSREKVSAPSSVSAGFVQYNLVKAFDFETTDSDFTNPANTSVSDGLVQVTPNVQTKVTFNFGNITGCDFVAVRMKADYGVNSYFHNSTWNYTFARTTGVVWTCDDAWASTADNRKNTGWTYNNDWNTYYISFGSTAGYWQNSSSKITTTGGGALATLFDLILENSAGGNVGNHQIEYVAFYKSSTATPTSISIGGDTLNLTEKFDFDATNAKATLASNMSLSSGSLVVQDSLNDGTKFLSFNSLSTFSCVAIRFKYSSTSPNMDFDSSSGNHYTYYRPASWNRAKTVFSTDWTARPIEIADACTARADTWMTHYIYKKGNQVYFVEEGAIFNGTSGTALTSFSTDLRMFFRDHNGGATGTYQVDYVAFYNN